MVFGLGWNELVLVVIVLFVVVGPKKTIQLAKEGYKLFFQFMQTFTQFQQDVEEVKEDTLGEIDKIKQEAQEELVTAQREVLADMGDATDIVKEGADTFQSDVDAAAQAVQESVKKPKRKKT